MGTARGMEAKGCEHEDKTAEAGSGTVVGHGREEKKGQEAKEMGKDAKGSRQGWEWALDG